MARAKRGTDGYFSTTTTIGRGTGGKRLRKRIRSKSLSGLQAKKAALEREIAQGRAPTQTVGQFLTQWLEQIVKPGNRPRTHARYSGDVKNYLVPHLGHHRLDKLTIQHVQVMTNTLHKKGLAPRSIRNIRAVLRRALKTAIRWGLVVRNVAEPVELPKAERPKTQALNVEQSRQLLGAVQRERLEALYWVALLLGLRQGEILGLRWQDIDLEGRTLQVSGAMSRQKQPVGKSKLVFVPTKTVTGTRQLPLPEILRRMLLKHKALQDEERTVQGWNEHGLVFASERGTPIEATNLICRSFKPALIRAELPNIRFHDLRHSCASLLIAMGVDPKTVSAILGHTSTAFTLSTYGHALPDITRQAVAELGSLLMDSDWVLELPIKIGRRDQKGDE